MTIERGATKLEPMKRLALSVVLLCFLVSSWAQLQRSNPPLQLPSVPPQRNYQLSTTFGLTFSAPVALVAPPGETNRLFVVEEAGRIMVITNVASRIATAVTFLDIRTRVLYGGEQGLLGLAFHPGYQTNGYFYVFYTAPNARFDRLSRFSVSATDPNAADASSELILLNQADDYENHNAGDLHFGPDGYLYVSLGDEGGGGDTGKNSQRIDKDFFSGILRIDVDKRSGNLLPNPHPAASTNYFVPADNPFVGATNFNGLAVDPAKAHTEFWAVGLRNPWRYSFDPLTGELWLGDVGQDQWEEIDIIKKGGNYGWNYREGLHAYTGTPPAAFQRADPIWDYQHTNGNSAVTGGLVYRGSRLSQLYGAYVFADYGSGNTWALRRGTNGVANLELLTVSAGTSAFGVDPSNGDILAANVQNGQIKRLTYSTTTTGSPIPDKLSATGAFSDLATLTPSVGVIPYEVNVPFWSDGAIKKRWFAITNANQKFTFDPTNTWLTPTSAVWIKHFEMQMTNGDAASARRLETRFIVRNANGVYGATYRWTNATEAALVPEEGMDETLAINDGGVVRTQVWHYPSRSECLTCHNASAGYVLGFNTAQMNRDVTYGAITTNQIRALADAGYMDHPSIPPQTLPALAPAADADASQEFRVRSYLVANCSQCHRPGGLALGNMDLRIATATDSAHLINGALLNNFGDTNNRAIVPNDPERSLILHRMSIRGAGQMPPIASNVADPAGVELLRSWIVGDLPTRQSFPQWQVAKFHEPLPPEAGAQADPDADGASNLLEYLANGDPLSPDDAWGVRAAWNNGLELHFQNPPNRAVIIETASSLPATWTPLDVPENQPRFPAIAGDRIVKDAAAGDGQRLYRARIAAP